jgi:hypothetical protein
MIKVRLYARESYNSPEKAAVEIQVNIPDEIEDLMRYITNDEIDRIIRGIAYLNPLGSYLYRDIKVYNKYNNLLEGSYSCNVWWTLVNREYMDEISKYITQQFAKTLAYAIDAPEINEKVATLTFPKFAVEQLKKEYPLLKEFKIDFYMKKKRGLNDVDIKQITSFDHYSITSIMQYLTDATPYLIIYLDDFNPPNSTLRVGYDTVFEIPYSKISLRGNINDTIAEIKEKIQQSVKEIAEKEYLNLVLASFYKGLFHSSSIELFNRKELSNKYSIPEIIIKRQNLFDDITVRFRLKTPRIEELCEKSTVIPIEIDTDEGTFHFNFIISAPEKEYIGHIIVPKEVKKARMERLINKDISVIREVENIDKKVVKQLESGIKSQVVKALAENGIIVKNRRGNYKFSDKYTISRFRKREWYPCKISPPDIKVETSVDDIEEQVKEEKQKIIAYLVAQKIKNSIKGD